MLFVFFNLGDDVAEHLKARFLNLGDDVAEHLKARFLNLGDGVAEHLNTGALGCLTTVSLS